MSKSDVLIRSDVTHKRYLNLSADFVKSLYGKLQREVLGKSKFSATLTQSKVEEISHTWDLPMYNKNC